MIRIMAISGSLRQASSVPEASPTIPLAGNRVDEATFAAAQPENATALRAALDALVRAIETQRVTSPSSCSRP